MPSQPRSWKEALERRLGPDRIQEGVPLAPLTTFRIGGPADLLFRARTAQELVDALSHAREMEIPQFLLGMGANILVADAGFRGLVIRNEVGGTEFLDSNRVRVGAGVEISPSLIQDCLERGLGGLHHFAGIPSTVGGAMWQNLHFLSPAPERERTVFLEEFVESDEIFSAGGRLEEVGRDYFDFGYDYSILHDRADTVLSVTFQLHPEPREVLQRVVSENLQWRSERHPPLDRYPSAGSIFKKVQGIGAGRLIDECGLKGQVIGSAKIYHRHANIIVNLGDATAQDVLGLIRAAQEAVRSATGHELVPEITLVGDFDEGVTPPNS